MDESELIPTEEEPSVQEVPQVEEVTPEEASVAVEVPKKSHKFLKATAATLAILGLTVGACTITGALVSRSWQVRANSIERTLRGEISRLEEELAGKADAEINHGGVSVSGTGTAQQMGMTPGKVYAENVRCVVAISNHSTTTNIYGQVSQTASSGSGFILSEEGYVVTNYHVVEGANTLTVITYDSGEYDAEIIGHDANNDVALLKIEAEGLQAAKLGSSDDLIVGDQVVAIGNPLGELTSTLTVGYISAKDRTINTEGTNINMMQTDAAINAGNSGGPLFNMLGQVVGITTAKYSGSVSSGASIEGIGFAIPIDDVVGMVQDLKEFGYVTGAYLGVSVRSMDAEISNLYGLPQGSYVEGVEPGSCAEKAGIQPKDIIVAVGEYPVEGNSDLTRALRKYHPGDEITVTVFRAGKNMVLPITLDSKPAPEGAGAPDTSGMPQDGSFQEWYNYFFKNPGE